MPSSSAPAHGVVTCAMRCSHHIDRLAALARKATEVGCHAMLASSRPHDEVVAPFAGREGLFSLDPFVVAYPAKAVTLVVPFPPSGSTDTMRGGSHE